MKWSKSSCVWTIITASLILVSSLMMAQEKHDQSYLIAKDPEISYPVPYEIPSPDSIKMVLDRVKDYFYTATPFRVINRDTRQTITDFSTIDQNAAIDTSPGEFNLWTYTMGVVHSGMNLVTEVTGDRSYLDYTLKSYDFIFDHLPYFRELDKRYGEKKDQYSHLMHMAALDHCGSIGAALIKTYYKNKDPRYRAMIDTVAGYISNKQFRLPDGTLARERPQAQSLWTDDFYMSIPFLAQMGKLTGEKKYFDDAVRQVEQMSARLFDWDKKLYDHGWNANESEFDPKFYWSRSDGWAMMAMVELLTVLPETYPGREKVIRLLNTNAQGLAAVQDGTGFWHQMLDKPDSYLETSGTAMFVFAIARGINKGWIDYTYAPVVLAGWNALTTVVQPNGQIEGICVGTTFASDNVYYYNRPTSVYAMHGYGPVLLAGAEVISLLKNPQYTWRFNNTIFIRPVEGN